MEERDERAEGTQTESSGGAGDHPLPVPDEPGEGGGEQQKVVERQEEATTRLREDSPDA